jgi:hypothetical protein
LIEAFEAESIFPKPQGGIAQGSMPAIFIPFLEDLIMTWVPMFAFPNIRVTAPVEVPSLALVYADDARVQALATEDQHFKLYLDQFATEFGDKILPSLLGSRLIKSTTRGLRRGRQRPNNFAPACRNGWRYV